MLCKCIGLLTEKNIHSSGSTLKPLIIVTRDLQNHKTKTLNQVSYSANYLALFEIGHDGIQPLAKL